jgi:predicted nucleic acid-binding protein
MVICEVYRHLAKHRGTMIADRFVSQALHRRVVPLDETIGLAAATVTLDHRLTGTDAIIFATARVR